MSAILQVIVTTLSFPSFEKGRYATIKFVDDLLHPQYQVSVNVYTYMFICDFFNFFVLIFGFSAFGVSKFLTVIIYITFTLYEHLY